VNPCRAPPVRGRYEKKEVILRVDIVTYIDENASHSRYSYRTAAMKPNTPTYSFPPTDSLSVARVAASAWSIDSATLLGARGEVEISHSGEIYRLRRTRQGKLILTK
ncbi:MAG: hemin uptake protein HemP, partial [Rhodocyclaceae bacterium]